MTVQTALCQTCSETTLLVFPRGGSVKMTYDDVTFEFQSIIVNDDALENLDTEEDAIGPRFQRNA